MNSANVQYRNSEIHYLDYGTGDNIIIAFHGYGETAGAFGCLSSVLSSSYRLIAIDLPFHGSTQWKEPEGCSTADIIAIIDQILTNAGVRKTDFVLMGYSTGGRIALSITESIPARVNRLILLAPDGMKMNFWYWLATQSKPGNRLLRSIINTPGWFFAIIRFSNSLHVVNRSVARFVLHYIGNRELRNQLYHRWICLRDIKPDLKKIRSIILERKLPVEMLYGRHDRIILSDIAHRFRKGLEEHCRLHIITAGHNLLQPKHAATIVSLLSP